MATILSKLTLRLQPRSILSDLVILLSVRLKFLSAENSFEEQVNSIWHEQVKDFFFDAAKPDLNFDGNEAIYIGDISHC